MTDHRLRYVALLSTVLVLLTGGHPSPLTAQSSTAVADRGLERPLVFDGVTVIDVQNGHRLTAQRVVIIGNRIQTIGSVQTVPMPAGGRVIDARGKFLIPGLWDMHVHPDADTALFYKLFIANGVTGIRNAGSAVPIATMRLWQREILAGTRVGPPRQLLAGPAIDGPDGQTPCTNGPGESHFCVADSAAARHLVDSLKGAGADFIKTYALKRDLYFVIAAEARRVGIPFGGHLYRSAATAIEASDSGVGILDHTTMAGDLYARCLVNRTTKHPSASVALCQPVAEHFQHNGTWWVPTLLIEQIAEESQGMDHLPGKPQMRAATQALRARLVQADSLFWHGEAVPRNWLSGTVSGAPADSGGILRLAHRVGLPILAGTDVNTDSYNRELPPGLTLHTELAVYVAEGLTPLEALQTATLNPARYLHGTDSLGTVAAGKLADLVLLDADPLVDITNTTLIRAVVANGRYFDRPMLDRLLAQMLAIHR